jgi:hypothetical protein
MAILNHGSTIRTADGGQSTTNIVTASNIGTYGVAVNSTYYVGTTQNVFNRASGAQTLTGVSIDGNAATVTNGVYTTGAQTIAGAKTFSDVLAFNANVDMGTSTGSKLPGHFYTNTFDGTNVYFHIGTSSSTNKILNLRVFDSANNFATYLFNSTGTASAPGDFRAPIFYDSNNTAYYCDPASTSVLNALTIGGNTALTTASTLTAGNLSGTIPSGVLGNSTHYIGTTAIALNRGSASQTLTGVSIDGNAATATNGLTTSNYGGYSTFSGVVSSASGGFQTATYAAGRNRIWSFGNSDGYGLAYFQGSGGVGGYDVIGMHFGTATAAASQYQFNAIGSFTASGDVRAPIFYDSGNTAYYLDPASTSNLNILSVAGRAGIGGAASRSTNGLTVGFTDNSAFAANTDVGDTDRMLSIVNESSTTNAMAVLAFRINPNGGTANAMLDVKFVQTGATCTSGLHYTFNHGGSFLDRFSILSSGNVGIGAIAPDTNLQVVGHVHVGNQTTFENTGGWNKTIYLDGAVHARMRILGSAFASGKNSATETSIWVDNSAAPYSGLDTNAGSFRINAGFTTILNSARSPIFYDSDNTAYYIDAASTSNLVGLTVANTITGSISGNAATATNSSQLGGVAAANYVRNDVDGTDSTALFRLTTITKSLTITTSWLDTGIIGANLATGCYMISLYVDNYAVNGGHYQETYTGMMSWFSTGTNATDYDEIVLHKSGHAPNGAYINLRTIRQLSGGTNLKLQIISSVSTNGASNYIFKFRRLI